MHLRMTKKNIQNLLFLAAIGAAGWYFGKKQTEKKLLGPAAK